MDQNKLLVKLENAGVYRSSKWLVRGISLEINQGQIVTLIGPNGSGKTTTAKMILNIMNADEGMVSGNADKHLPSLIQKHVSFMQMKSVATNPSQTRVAEFLRQKGSAINSRVLSALAVRVAEDPFTKVKKMIKDLIVRLMEEANEEAEHKGWC